MKRYPILIIHNPHCPQCRGAGSIRNPLSRPKTWQRLEKQAVALIVDTQRQHGIARFPAKAWDRLLSLRRIAGRYQSTRPCPLCAIRQPWHGYPLFPHPQANDWGRFSRALAALGLPASN